jgi:HAMP domain-containing protein
MGIARVSLPTRAQELIVDRLQRDVLVISLGATLLALLLSAVFARSVTRPILELRDDAKAIAAGDLERRPALNVSGEVGELATAFHQLAEQLSTRLRALEADDALLRALMDSLNEGAVALDSRQQVVHVNAQAADCWRSRRVPSRPISFPVSARFARRLRPPSPVKRSTDWNSASPAERSRSRRARSRQAARCSRFST